jgi:hypothetical protein
MPMNAFLVELSNKPGELARVAEAIAAAGVNITAFSGSTCGDGGNVAFMTADDSATRSVLQNAVIPFREVEAIETPLPHKPGTLAKAARRLADAGINIEAVLATGMDGGNVTVAFVTGDPARAKETLAHADATQG